MHTHTYSTRLHWTGSTDDYSSYNREYDVSVEGKPVLRGSADPVFRGSPDMYNPEDLFVASIAACHMLAYLALCARRNVRVLAYEDDARGSLVLAAGGGGRFSEVTLSPHVTIAVDSDPALALSLHEDAHARCFIASSCSVPILHRARITAAAQPTVPEVAE